MASLYVNLDPKQPNLKLNTWPKQLKCSPTLVGILIGRKLRKLLPVTYFAIVSDEEKQFCDIDTKNQCYYSEKSFWLPVFYFQR
jgi:hypothetical protein